MGMVADPAAASNRLFYVCYASAYGGSAQDVRVVRWRLDNDTTAVRDGANPVVVRGIPISQRPAQRVPAPLRAGRQALRRHR